MKIFLILLAICIAAVACFTGCGGVSNTNNSTDNSTDEVFSDDSLVSEDNNIEVEQNEFDLAVDLTAVKRGVNLSALEDPNKYSKFLFEDDTYANIAEKGFDHVRFPVDFRNYSDKNGVLNEEKMKDVDGIIKACNEAGLVVFLDFHGWYNLNTNKGDDILFMKIWKNLAERYKNYEHNDMLIFELINEPHDTEGGNLDMASLSMLQGLTANTIRSISPNRTICFATAEWNGSWTLKSDVANSYRKSVLMNYENVIVAVHTYATIEFTHQNIAWNGTQGKFVKLDDTVLDELKKQLKDMMDFTAETGVPVILFEVAATTEIYTIPYEDQAKYVQTIMDVLSERDVPWSWWAYCNGEFAIYKKTSRNGDYKWNDTLIDVMMK